MKVWRRNPSGLSRGGRIFTAKIWQFFKVVQFKWAQAELPATYYESTQQLAVQLILVWCLRRFNMLRLERHSRINSPFASTRKAHQLNYHYNSLARGCAQFCQHAKQQWTAHYCFANLGVLVTFQSSIGYKRVEVCLHALTRRHSVSEVQ